MELQRRVFDPPRQSFFLFGPRGTGKSTWLRHVSELDHFEFEAALTPGLLPLVVAADRPDDVLRAYASLYLHEEVRLEGWARNVGVFARFLEAISFSHAAVLNVANVARECQVERKTAAAYVEVLEDLLLSFRVPVFTRRARRDTSTHPKFFLFDAGVFRSLRPKGPLDRPQEIAGAALEGLVAQHLRAWLAYRESDAELFFWRTRSGVEVDFIVYGAAGFWAIEVKNTDRVRQEDLRGLAAFGADYSQAELVLLYRGTRRERRGRTWILPVEDFLRTLHPATTGRPRAALGVPWAPRVSAGRRKGENGLEAAYPHTGLWRSWERA